MTDRMAKTDEPKDDKYNKRFGLDISFDEALQRFGRVTQEELEAAADDGDGGSLIPEGKTDLVPFQKVHIRRVFREGEWWFSITDLIEALTETTDAPRYWSKLKHHMIEEEGFSELDDEIVRVQMVARDGKMQEADTATPETLFRIIQSVRTPRAEAMKRWLAKVAYERIREIQNPEIAVKRAIMEYQLQGRSMELIEQRIRSIMVRKELTTEWKKRGVDEFNEFAILTNVLSTRTFGIGISEHKKQKSIKPHHNLRDHMVDLELIFTMLAERSTKEIATIRDARGFLQNKDAARVGGDVAGNARRNLERETGRPVVSHDNFLPPKLNGM